MNEKVEPKGSETDINGHTNSLLLQTTSDLDYSLWFFLRWAWAYDVWRTRISINIESSSSMPQ